MVEQETYRVELDSGLSSGCFGSLDSGRSLNKHNEMELEWSNMGCAKDLRIITNLLDDGCGGFDSCGGLNKEYRIPISFDVDYRRTQGKKTDLLNCSGSYIDGSSLR